MNKISQAYESYAKGAAFDAGEGEAMRLKVRSLVGLLPLCASTVFEPHTLGQYPKLMELIALFKKRHPELVSHVSPTDEGFVGHRGRRLLAILNKKKMELLQ